MLIDIKFPAPFECLFQPKRYKILYGGRGGAKSWGVARALLLLGTENTVRVLCAREIQNSIAESVHRLLSDQILALGLVEFYEIQVNKIIGKNGTTFFFEGIKNNVNKIRSFEGVDICWVEEANNVSKNSWSVLIPTIRKPKSEIWLTFNPELETDYTYKTFVKEMTPDRGFVVKVTWKDNPWFPVELKEEMEHLKKIDYDSYLHVWEGFTLQNLDGAVFAKELRRATEDGRICQVPWDRETPVDTFWDLGRRDMTAIWFAQKVAMQYRVLGYFEASQEDIHFYLKECQKRPYTYGTFFLPHDASKKELVSKRSIAEIVRNVYPRVHVVPRTNAKVNAINAARLIFPNCWFDEAQCEEGIARLRHYRYKVVNGQLSNEPLHDNNSNGADAFMTMAQSIKSPKDWDGVKEKLRAVKSQFAENARGLGWLG